MVYDQFSKRNGQTADYAAYYGDSIIRLSHVLPDSELAKEVPIWMKQVLGAQEPDGYMGGYPSNVRWGLGPAGDQWLEIFSQSLMVHALMDHYQRTHDQFVLDACEKDAHRMIKAYHQPESEVKQSVIFASHGVLVVRAMQDLYHATGKAEYESFAKDVLDKYGYALQRGSGAKPASCEGEHGAIESEHVSFPATVFEMNGDRKYLQASLDEWNRESSFITVDGMPTSDEGITKINPRSIGEHCAGIEWADSNYILLRATGDVKYADAAEREVFNAYPAAKSPDTKTLGYMHSANELVAAEWSRPSDFNWEHWITRTYYTSATFPLCCSVNSSRGIPYFIDTMVLRTSDGGLAAAYYGPAKIKTDVPGAGNVKLVMDTQYPFEDVVRITVNPDKSASFPLQLRIPGWCSSATLELNGKPLDAKPLPGKFATVRREWHKGDVVTLSMQLPIKLVDHAEGELFVGGSAVERGPLTYVLPVEEDWQRFHAPWVHGPAHDKEHVSYRILPKKGSKWNYALIVDKANLAKSFTFKRFPRKKDAVLWKDPQVGLEVKAREVVNWEMEGSLSHPQTPNLPYKPMNLSDRVTTVTLIPFGCTRLRMSYLPIIDK